MLMVLDGLMGDVWNVLGGKSIGGGDDTAAAKKSGQLEEWLIAVKALPEPPKPEPKIKEPQEEKVVEEPPPRLREEKKEEDEDDDMSKEEEPPRPSGAKASERVISDKEHDVSSGEEVVIGKTVAVHSEIDKGGEMK